jgi:uncharacterized membrane protein
MAEGDRDKSFDRIAILVLAVEWVMFGSMHFSKLEDTMAMIPFGSDGFKLNAAVMTGILEVSTGVLLLVPELRKWAALASLGLLLLLAPAMYHILAVPESVASLGAMQTPFRVILLPNNIFLAICSVHLWLHPNASLARVEAVRRVRQRQPRGPVTLIVPALLLMANCAGFLALAISTPGHSGVASMWAMACIAAGALIGFLFGVPRINPNVRLTGRLIPNANVEAVSDWLTKILVGVGLVNFRAIGDFIGRLSVDVGRATATDKAFAAGLIVYFFVVGIIQGYILTRMFLASQFANDDDSSSSSGIVPKPEPAGRGRH